MGCLFIYLISFLNESQGMGDKKLIIDFTKIHENSQKILHPR